MDVEAVLRALGDLGNEDLLRVRDAANERLGLLRESSVLERRAHGAGVLQLEMRTYAGTGRQRGPYWYFKYREGGRQRTLYVGKTETPEAMVEEKLARRAGGENSL
ncbi:MAG: hypothetical protein M3P49_17265 [Actinomycetota bacterium]|nr:hypothetical protein [Actinomycetota bacterium]